MKEQEFRVKLQRLYGDIPEDTHQAFMQALTGSKRQKQTMGVPRLRLLSALLLLLTMVVCCTAAYASSYVGIDWYYHSVMDRNYLEEVCPGLYDDIMANLRFMPDQEVPEDDLVNIAVTEVSWIPERKILTLYIASTAKKPEQVELCSGFKLNVDGFEDDRTENWLWTKRGDCGPVLEQVEDPSKDIWFLDVNGIYLGEGDDRLTGWCDGLYPRGKSIDYMAQINMSKDLDERTAALFEQYAQQNQLPLRIRYIVRHYDKENDEVDYYSDGWKEIKVTVDLTPKTH